MDSALTAQERTVLERTSARYQTTLTDADDSAIALASVSTLTLKLFVTGEATAFIRGSTSAGQDVLNANNCTLHATSGLLTWSIQPADTQMKGTTPPATGAVEEHTAIFEITLTDGSVGRLRLILRCVQLANTPDV